MSIGSIGSAGNPLLLAMLTRLSATSGDGPSSSGASGSAATPVSDNPGNSVTGNGKAQFSDQILALLVQMQSGSTSSTASSSSTGVNPLSQLMSAVDTDGDGTISQSELETFIEGKGGTQGEADALFSGLGGQNGSGNLTQSQLSNDLQQASLSPMHGHHHGHHHGHGASADKVASQLMQAMDSNGSGGVSQSEFENFVTGLGGTTGEADADFAALGSQNAASISVTQFSSAISAFQAAGMGQNNPASPILSLLDDIAKNPAPTTSV